VVPPNGKTGPKSYGGYAWAEEPLLPGGASPLIISNDDDDDLVSMGELFARADLSDIGARERTHISPLQLIAFWSIY
jgi:hypothetical protein